MVSRSEERCVADMNRMVIQIVSVYQITRRQQRFEPKVDAVRFRFIVRDDLHLKADPCLRHPYLVDLFQYRPELGTAATALSHVDAERYAVDLQGPGRVEQSFLGRTPRGTEVPS